MPIQQDTEEIERILGQRRATPSDSEEIDSALGRIAASDSDEINAALFVQAKAAPRPELPRQPAQPLPTVLESVRPVPSAAPPVLSPTPEVPGVAPETMFEPPPQSTLESDIETMRRAQAGPPGILEQIQGRTFQDYLNDLEEAQAIARRSGSRAEKVIAGRGLAGPSISQPEAIAKEVVGPGVETIGKMATASEEKTLERGLEALPGAALGGLGLGLTAFGAQAGLRKAVRGVEARLPIREFLRETNQIRLPSATDEEIVVPIKALVRPKKRGMAVGNLQIDTAEFSAYVADNFPKVAKEAAEKAKGAPDPPATGSAVTESMLEKYQDILKSDFAMDPEAKTSVFAYFSAAHMAALEKGFDKIIDVARISRGWTGRRIMGNLFTNYRRMPDQIDSYNAYINTYGQWKEHAAALGLRIKHEFPEWKQRLIYELIKGDATEKSINELVIEGAKRYNISSKVLAQTPRFATAKEVVLTPGIQDAIDIAKSIIMSIGEVGEQSTKVLKGPGKALLERGTWEKHFGSYLHRQYIKDVESQFELEPVEQELKLQVGQTGTFKARKLTEEEAKETGKLIEDPAYLVSSGLSKVVRTTELYRHYENLIKQGLVSNKPVKGWYHIRVSAKPTVVGEEKALEWRMPRLMGPLTNKWVHPNVRADIETADTFVGEVDGFFRRANSIIKRFHTVHNLATITANIFGNVFTADIAGFPVARQAQYVFGKAAKMVFSERELNPLFLKMRELGVTRTGFGVSEIGRWKLADLALKSPRMTPGGILDAVERISYHANKTGLTPTQIYGNIEDMWKAGMWLYRRDQHVAKGIAEAKAEILAAREVNKGLFNYNEVSRAIMWIRSNAFVGSPFITYGTKAIPLVLKQMTNVDPGVALRYWKWPVIFLAYEKMLYNGQGISDKEQELVRKTAPPWMRTDEGFSKYVLGPMNIPLPINRQDGRIDYISLNSAHPMSSIAHWVSQTLEGEVPDVFKGDIAFGMLARPLLEIALDKDFLTGREIYKPGISWGQIAEITANRLYRAFAPAAPIPTSPFFATEAALFGAEVAFPGGAKLPQGYGAERITQALRGAKDIEGYKMDLATQVAKFIVGGRYHQRNPEADARKLLSDLSRETKELEKRLFGLGASLAGKGIAADVVPEYKHILEQIKQNADTARKAVELLRIVEKERRAKGVPLPPRPELGQQQREFQEQLSVPQTGLLGLAGPR